ncbi:hypothetical protein C7999DRAFT_27642 [Corynascus novoguineensis]|uniref:Uncharacterized protein n=1 Tax=Corynascus novoguineensis TaxID=1126955 RepID=A0AAN7D0U9_9PEZI|nr:hypothetical protein C7999DRAFT_27642 [Corynascus novoguineensis]
MRLPLSFSDGIFELGSFTEERSPQFKRDNMSSGQVASASASADGYPNHKPPSNMSTETPGTDDTVTGIDPPKSPSPHPILTTFQLALHQRSQEQSYTDSVKRWVDNAGAGINQRLEAGVNDGNNNSNDDGTGWSVAADSRLSVAGSSSSSAGGPGADWVIMMEPNETDEDVAGAGGWCDYPMPPVMTQTQGAVLSDKETGGFWLRRAQGRLSQLSMSIGSGFWASMGAGVRR